MSRINKQTTNSFYNTSYTDHAPFSFKRKLATSNSEVVQRFNIEVQSKIEKLKEKISIDETKIQRNYVELQQLSLQIQQSCQKIFQDKQIQATIRNRKELIKEVFSNCKNKTNSNYTKSIQQTSNIRQALGLKQRELERQRQQRQNDVLKMIDQFETDIMAVQKQLKHIRLAQEEVFQHIEVDIYNLEQNCSAKLQKEASSRKKEHETIIKLIGQCIQNFRYIY